MARKRDGEVSGERIRRILQQAEEHGGLRQLAGRSPAVPALDGAIGVASLDLPYARRTSLLPRAEPGFPWEQLRFPWA